MTELDARPEKILLLLLPFWSPLIPPVGIACLKSHLKRYGYSVKNYDLNIESGLRDDYDRYFQELSQALPGREEASFGNIANDVLRNHLMAGQNEMSESDYLELVGEIIYGNFYERVPSDVLLALNRIVADFYSHLADCFHEIMVKERPSILGVSIFNGSLPASLYICKQARARYLDLKIVVGGGIFSDDMAPNSPSLEYFVQNTPYIDKIFVGEGEALFLKYFQGELDLTKKVYTQADSKNESIPLANLDIPDFTDFDFNHYPYCATFASRSCPYQCNFCSETVSWGKYRKKEAGQILAEMKKLYELYGGQLFLMADSLLNPVIDELAELLVKDNLSFYWDGYLRANPHVCNTDNTFLWRQAGFYRARLGLESGSERILKLMDKKITVPQVKEAVASLAKAGIKTTTYWVIGYPGETEADFQQTLDLITELKDDIYEAHANPFNYYYSGQVQSENWKSQYRIHSLYPEKFNRELMLQTWVIECEPQREEVYQRLWRFAEHCSRLKIADPSSLRDIYEADRRWKKLHQNAVPALAEFKQNNYMDENKRLKKLVSAKKAAQENNDWGF